MDRLKAVLKFIFSSSGHSPKTGLFWKQASTRQRGLFTTALLGLALVRSTRATAANHRQLISPCGRDELGVANSNVTSEVTDQACPQHSACPAAPRLSQPWSTPRGARGEQGTLSASS